MREDYLVAIIVLSSNVNESHR